MSVLVQGSVMNAVRPEWVTSVQAGPSRTDAASMPRRSHQQQITTMSIRCCNRRAQSCGPLKSSEFWFWGSLAMSSTKNESFSFEGPRPLSTARSTCAILSKTSGGTAVLVPAMYSYLACPKICFADLYPPARRLAPIALTNRTDVEVPCIGECEPQFPP